MNLTKKMVKRTFEVTEETARKLDNLWSNINDRLPTEYDDDSFLDLLVELGEEWRTSD